MRPIRFLQAVDAAGSDPVSSLVLLFAVVIYQGIVNQYIVIILFVNIFTIYSVVSV